MLQCAFCQREITLTGRVGRLDSCSFCGRDLHCCYQCHFYDVDAHHECREPQADFVKEKDQANFCDWFRFEPRIKVKVADKEAQKARLESLFKKK